MSRAARRFGDLDPLLQLTAAEQGARGAAGPSHPPTIGPILRDRDGLDQALTSPVTWGIVLAYVVGKPLGIVAVARAASRGADRRAAGRPAARSLTVAVPAP